MAEFLAHVTSARKLYHSLVLSGAYPGVFSIWVNPAVTIVIRPAAHPDEACSEWRNNGNRLGDWKIHLQQMADQIRIPITLSSGNQQVEQDRAPALFVYQFELERVAVDQF